MTCFDAWALPAESPSSGRTAVVEVEPGGASLRYPLLEPTDAGELCDFLERRRTEGLAGRGVREIAGALGAVGRRFLQKGDDLRAQALELLPEVAGLSPAMARAVLDGMARDWTPERLHGLLRAELGEPTVLDGFRRRRNGGRVRAMGPTVSVHICSGTVPGVSVTSLIRALLVKSAAIVKPGRGDAVLPVLFTRGLQEEYPALASSVAVLYWPGGDEPLEEAFLGRAGAVVAYGGNETVRSLRDRTPVTARFVGYRHRISAGLVGREVLGDRPSADEAARRVAGAVATFDQRGCVSPHVVYVEGGGEVEPGAWARELGEALGELESSLPSGPLLPGEASEIQQLRGVAELRAAAGEDVAVYHGGGAPWTVAVEPDPGFRPSCLGRVVRIRPVEDLRDAVQELADVGRVLQTVALEGAGGRRAALAEALAAGGAVRITSFDRAPWPPPWWHHDGTGPLEALIRWVDLEVGEESPRNRER